MRASTRVLSSAGFAAVTGGVVFVVGQILFNSTPWVSAGAGAPVLLLGGLLLGGGQACLLGARIRRRWAWFGWTFAGAILGWGIGTSAVEAGVAKALGLATRSDWDWALVLAGIPAGDAVLALLQTLAMRPAPRRWIARWVLAAPVARLAGTGAALLVSPVHWSDMPVYWAVAIAVGLGAVVYTWRPATEQAGASAPPAAA